MQIGDPTFQPGLILFPRHAIDSRRSVSLQGEIAGSEQIHAQMVEQSSEPFLSLFPGYWSHTAQSLGHWFPALSRARVGRSDVLLSPRPFLPCLRRRLLLVVRQVHRYYGAVRLLWNVPSRCAAIRLFGLVSILVGSRGSRGLPVLVHVVSQRARVLRLRSASRPLANLRGRLCCLPCWGSGRRSIPSFSELHSPAHRYPCLRFDGNLAASAARLRVKMESLLLSCGALSSPTTCRLSPAHPRHGFEPGSQHPGPK
jgi:hypothetical protein